MHIFFKGRMFPGTDMVGLEIRIHADIKMYPGGAV